MACGNERFGLRPGHGRRLSLRCWWAGGLRILSALLVGIAAVLVQAPLAMAQQPSFEELAARIGSLTRQARYTDAMKAADQLAVAARAAHGEEHYVYASALAWKATLHQTLGQLAEAEPLFERSLAIYTKVLPAGHPDIATSINNLGFQYQVTGRLEEAEKFYKRALEMREKAAWPNYSHIADSLNNIAQIYKRQWRVAESVPLLRRALEMRERGLGQEHPLIAQSLQNLASALELQNEIPQAEPLLRRAYDIRVKSQSANHPELAGAIGKLGQNLFKQGKYGDAEPLFREAMRIRRGSQAAGHLDIATSLADLGNNFIAQGKASEAAPLFSEALAITQASLPATHTSIARMHMGLADARAASGKVADALDSIRQGTKVRLTRRSGDDMSRLHFFKHARIAWMAASKASAGASGDISRELFDESLQMAQRATQTDTAVAVQNMAARFAAKDPTLQALVRQREETDSEISLLEQQLSATLAQTPEQRGKAGEDVRTKIAASTKGLAAIDVELKVKYPDYFALVRPEPLDRSQIASLLAPDEALVAMITSYDATYVWAVTREDAAWHKVDMTVDQLSDAIIALRETLDVESLKQNLRSNPKLFDLALSHHLYKKLLGPLESLLAGKAHLVTVPYGPLSSLPLQVLVTGGTALAHPELKHLTLYHDTEWLMRRHAVSVLPSVGSLQGLRVLAKRSSDQQRPLIGFGNPRFTATRVADSRGSAKKGATRTADATRTRSISTYWRGAEVNHAALRDLPPLPETEGELKTVAQHLGATNKDLRLNLAATETSVKQMDLSVYRIVYFATHGLVAGELKGLAEPALALTPPATPTALDDGLLTASEVAQLRLNADWVVLAACNTAAGDTPGAEALSGLARAFFYAGARALLVSHWRVGSEAAAKLTTSTFEAKQNDPTIGRAESLRRAMITYVGNKKDPWSGYPAFWAPFSVVGEGGQ